MKDSKVAISKLVFVACLLGTLAVGLIAGFYIVTPTALRNNNTLTNSSSTSNTGTSRSSIASTSTSIVSTQASSEYALSSTDSIKLGWALDGQYSGTQQYNNANLFVLQVTNIGQDSLTSLSYTVQNILGSLGSNATVASGSSETFQTTFVGYDNFIDCGTTNVGFCPQQASLTVDLKFSDGASYSIPQTISISYGTVVSPYTYDRNSPFCSQIIPSFSSVSASYGSGEF